MKNNNITNDLNEDNSIDNTMNSSPSRLSRMSFKDSINTKPSDQYLYNVEKHASRLHSIQPQSQLDDYQQNSID